MRDHNAEYQDNAERQYAYDFDYLMRDYMMRTFAPYYQGKALELGCFEGGTTQRLARYFDDLTVVEAADSLIEIAKTNVPERVKFIHATIETAELEPVYDSIFLMHTLEHLDDPIPALARIRNWLSPTGRLFVVVPNANAASRQIAVKSKYRLWVTQAEGEAIRRVLGDCPTQQLPSPTLRAAGN